MCFLYTQMLLCGHTSGQELREPCDRLKAGQPCNKIEKTVHAVQPCWRCIAPLKEYMNSRPSAVTATGEGGTGHGQIGFTSPPGRYQAYQAPTQPRSGWHQQQQQPQWEQSAGFTPYPGSQQSFLTTQSNNGRSYGGIPAHQHSIVPIEPQLFLPPYQDRLSRTQYQQSQAPMMSRLSPPRLANDNSLYYNANAQQQPTAFNGALAAPPPPPALLMPGIQMPRFEAPAYRSYHQQSQQQQQQQQQQQDGFSSGTSSGRSGVGGSDGAGNAKTIDYYFSQW